MDIRSKSCENEAHSDHYATNCDVVENRNRNLNKETLLISIKSNFTV